MDNNILVSDNISTKGILSTGGSNALKSYSPIFNATVIDRLLNNNYKIKGKTKCTEFGVSNLIDDLVGAHIYGAKAIKEGEANLLVCSDTNGGSIMSANNANTYAFKPTYGLVSRFGLFPFASSTDTISFISNSFIEISKALNIVKGKDENDMTSYDKYNKDLTIDINKDITGKRIAYIKEVLLDNYSSEDIERFNKAKEELTSKGAIIEEVSIDKNILNKIESVYKVITSSEASSNLSYLTSLNFGERENGSNYEELMKNYRTNNLTSYIKELITFGSFCLYKDNIDEYFHKACKVRRVITEAFNNIFSKYDAIINPINTNSINNNILLVPSLGGYPSANAKGIHLMGGNYKDEVILNIANILSEEE